MPLGKLLVGGKFTSYNGSVSNNIVRINANGSKDAVFAGSIANSVNDVAIQTDGKILVGINNDGNGLVTKFFVRLNTSGAIDASFNVGQPGANSSVMAIKVQGDGKILVGGDFSGFNDLSSNFTRINADGSLDAGFDNRSFIGGVKTIKIQADQKILIGFGEYKDIYPAELEEEKVTRLNADGSPDASFQYDFYSELNESVFDVLVQPDGKILVGETFVSRQAGSYARYINHAAAQVTPGMKDFRINRYNSDGSRDQQFGINGSQTGPNRTVLAVATQADGKLLIGGSFFTYNGVLANYFARLNADGSRDAGFNTGGIGFDKKVNSIAVQADGKIIAAGVFTKYNGVAASTIVRLNSDGSRDASFNAPVFSPGEEEIFAIKIQADGKIIAGGLNKLVRLNANGTLDNAFSAQVVGVYGIFFPTVYAIELQADGKIIVGGQFTYINSGDRSGGIARLMPDGSRDVGFTGSYPGQGSVYSIAVQPDGKIILGGDYYVSADNNVLRLNSNGALDASFNPGSAGANRL